MHAWIDETVYVDGDQFFDALFREIDRAEDYVHLETYIFDRDELGTEVLDRLKAAARRGVSVRLLLDGFGSSEWTSEHAELLRDSGVRTKFYHPLPWQIVPRIPMDMGLGRIFRSISKLNRRNHRKCCVVDGRVAFVGGMNVSARHINRKSGEKAWRDTSVRVTGSQVRLLNRAFENAWANTNRIGQAHPNPDSSVRLNRTRRERRSNYQDLIQRIVSAQNRVWITNPYFIPEVGLIRALRTASRNGIDVRLLLPGRNDVWGLKSVIRTFYLSLLITQVRIFEYAPTVLHAKTLLIDETAFVGSSNLNHRSLLHDLEVDVVLSRKETIQKLEHQFLVDLSSAEEIERRRWIGRSIFERILGRILLLFRNWI